jgi:hypothetical protein
MFATIRHALAGYTPGFINGFLAGVRFQLWAGVNSRVGVKEEVRSRVGLYILKAPLARAQRIQELGRIRPEAARIREAEGSTPHLENSGGHKARDGNLADKHMVLRTRSARAR